jgi:hypothetical protein
MKCDGTRIGSDLADWRGFGFGKVRKGKIMSEKPGDSFIQFIRSTMEPDDIVLLCAVLLGVEVDILRAWLARLTPPPSPPQFERTELERGE